VEMNALFGFAPTRTQGITRIASNHLAKPGGINVILISIHLLQSTHQPKNSKKHSGIFHALEVLKHCNFLQITWQLFDK